MKDKIINTRYVLITAARNEEKYIERTIQSVISQTILPEKWVIVSDGSTDGTDEIVKRYEAHYDFIQFMCLESNGERNFASQVYTQQVGVELLQDIKYEFIGMLDADISFQPDYYQRVIAKFQENRELGIAGGRLSDFCGGKWVRQRVSTSWSVSGPIQMFRRQCYEDIGGYFPLERGGQDGVAEVMARMHGWEVKSFPDIEVLHYRRTGTEGRNIWHARLNGGIIQYSVGYHWLFAIARSLYKIFERPYLLGSILTLCGFCWANLQKKELVVPDEVRQYLRREQLHKLLSPFSKNIDTNGSPA